MKTPHRGFFIGLVLFFLCMGSAYFQFHRDCYARLERMGRNTLRLSFLDVAPSLFDLSVGALHQRELRLYFAEEAQEEETKLLASGLLVESKIPVSRTGSQREPYQAFTKNFLKTGRYSGAWVDLTNRVVILISKPKDVASFSAALETA